MSCQRMRITPIGIHHIDLKVAITIGLEDNLAVIRRPGGVLIKTLSIRELAHLTAIRFHHIHIGVAGMGTSPLKAIRLPSGDQAGNNSQSALSVN